jgi:hypothetical protein
VMCGYNNKPWLDNLIKNVWGKHFETAYVHSQSVLGVHIDRLDPQTIAFSQKAYIEKLIKKYDLEGKKAKHVPIREGIEKDYDPDDMSTSHLDSQLPYRSLNMELMWIARSYRMDILYACTFFARFSQCYTNQLFEEMKDIVLYLMGTIDFRLIFRVNPRDEIKVHFMCDADFAMQPNRKSVVGIIGWVNDCVIYSQSSTTNTVLTSSCESESHAIFSAAKAAVYVHDWLAWFSRVSTPVFIFNDNHAAVTVLSRRSNTSRVKHFDVKLRYVTELCEQGKVELAFIPREKNGADILTHALSRRKFETLLLLIFDQEVYDLVAESFRSGGDSNWSVQLTAVQYEYIKTLLD